MMSDEFSWNDTDSLVVRQQNAIAVYANPNGDLVVRRKQDWNEEDDVWIVIARTQVRTVIDAMNRVLKDIEAEHANDNGGEK
jgi:hypothetical protein